MGTYDSIKNPSADVFVPCVKHPSAHARRGDEGGDEEEGS